MIEYGQKKNLNLVLTAVVFPLVNEVYNGSVELNLQKKPVDDADEKQMQCQRIRQQVEDTPKYEKRRFVSLWSLLYKIFHERKIIFF